MLLLTIITMTETERAAQRAVHPGVCCQPGPGCFQTPAQLGLDMAGHCQDDGRGFGASQLLHKSQLAVWPERCLKQDDVIVAP